MRKCFLYRAMETNTPIVYQQELSRFQRGCSTGQVLGTEDVGHLRSFKHLSLCLQIAARKGELQGKVN